MLQLLEAAELLRQRRAAFIPDGVLEEPEREGLQLLEAAELLRQRRATQLPDGVVVETEMKGLQLQRQ